MIGFCATCVLVRVCWFVFVLVTCCGSSGVCAAPKCVFGDFCSSCYFFAVDVLWMLELVRAWVMVVLWWYYGVVWCSFEVNLGVVVFWCCVVDPSTATAFRWGSHPLHLSL